MITASACIRIETCPGSAEEESRLHGAVDSIARPRMYIERRSYATPNVEYGHNLGCCLFGVALTCRSTCLKLGIIIHVILHHLAPYVSENSCVDEISLAMDD